MGLAFTVSLMSMKSGGSSSRTPTSVDGVQHMQYMRASDSAQTQTTLCLLRLISMQRTQACG